MSRGRSSSAPPGPRSSQVPSQVTIRTAKNEGTGASPTRTVTASEVRGITQADPSQRPTVYFRNPRATRPNFKAPDPVIAAGRATQQHDVEDNVGGHFQTSPETFFANINRRNLHQAPYPARQDFLSQAHETADKTADDAFKQAMGAAVAQGSDLESDETQQALTKVHTDTKVAASNRNLDTPRLAEATPTSYHLSRSAFQDLTSNNTGRERVIQDLRQGPLNTGTDNLARVVSDDGSISQSKDDWHVKRSFPDFSDL